MSTDRFYPIGTPGVPWSDDERHQWSSTRSVERSYREEVLAPLEGLRETHRVETYGALSVDPERYPLFCAHPSRVVEGAPWVLVTGGVHGYETSGVQGALLFLREHAGALAQRCNLVVAPCVSPWGYERVQRWNAQALDPNRSFRADSPSEEAAALWKHVRGLGVSFLAHFDLHETTDSDEDEFRPAVAARDGVAFEPGTIPDGFYTVGDTENPEIGFHSALIEGVRQVTHIAPPDENGEIIGSAVVAPGVILYPFQALGLCAGLTDARFATTTEVYPDSPRATDAICNEAQVAAVRAGLEYALESAPA